MTDVESLQAKLQLPPISQIGVIVRDAKKAAGYYSSLFGIGPFTIREFEPQGLVVRGEKVYSKSMMATAMWGNIELEVIQPIAGKSLSMEFLQQRGEGVNHFGFIVRNFDELREKFIQEGFKPIMEAQFYVEQQKGTAKACYFDTEGAVGTLFEIIFRSWLH